MPGMYSLYFWAEKTPPTGLNANDWMVMLSDRQQQQVVERVKSHEDLWAVVSPDEALSLVGSQRVENKPLVKFILSECRRVNAVGAIELGKYDGKGSSELVQCVHWGVLNAKSSQRPQDALQLVCRMPIALSHVGGPITLKYAYSSGAKHAFQIAADASPLAALVVVDLLTGRIIASSLPSAEGTGEVALLIPDAEPGKTQMVTRFPPVNLPEGRELCFTVRLPKSPTNDAPAAEIRRDQSGRWVNERALGVCLFAPNGELLDSIPFLTESDLNEMPHPRPVPLWRAPKEGD
jgi:hypothetical protein